MFSIVYSHTDAGGISTPNSEYCQVTLLLFSKVFHSDAPISDNIVASTRKEIHALHFAISIDSLRP
jgi:hypothetical protein